MSSNFPRFIHNVAEHNKALRLSIEPHLSKTCLIFGNGPSCSHANPNLENTFVCRTNWFFLEDEPKFGKVVDAYFCGIYNQEMIRQLESSKYQIKRFFAPFNIFANPTINDYLYRTPITSSYSHWSLIAENFRIGKEFIKRPLPTQGIQMIATAAVLGFKHIEIYGIDFYQGSGNRYCYSQNEKSLQALETKDIQPGYEANHSIETDKNILCLIREEFPDTTIHFN